MRSNFWPWVAAALGLLLLISLITGGGQWARGPRVDPATARRLQEAPADWAQLLREREQLRARVQTLENELAEWLERDEPEEPR